jgi:hypothetical protein
MKMKKTGMSLALMALAYTALVFTARCASQSEILAKQQPIALQTAIKRGQFDLNCPEATGEVLSSDYIQPAVQGGRWMAAEGVTRLEYTVGVQGCGKKEVFVVMCQYGTSTCFASNSHAPHQ